MRPPSCIVNARILNSRIINALCLLLSWGKEGMCNGYVTFRFPAAVSTDLTALIP